MIARSSLTRSSFFLDENPALAEADDFMYSFRISAQLEVPTISSACTEWLARTCTQWFKFCGSIRPPARAQLNTTPASKASLALPCHWEFTRTTLHIHRGMTGKVRASWQHDTGRWVCRDLGEWLIPSATPRTQQLLTTDPSTEVHTYRLKREMKAWL